MRWQGSSGSVGAHFNPALAMLRRLAKAQGLSMRHRPFRRAVLAVMFLDGEAVVEEAATYDGKELDLRAFHVRRALQLQATLETEHGVKNRRSLLAMVNSAEFLARELERMQNVAKRANSARHRRWACCPRKAKGPTPALLVPPSTPRRHGSAHEADSAAGGDSKHSTEASRPTQYFDLEPDEDIANDVYCPSLMDAVELHGHLEDLSLGWDSCIDDNGDDLDGDEGYVMAMEVLSEGEQLAVALGLAPTSTEQGAVHALGPSADSGEQHTSLRRLQKKARRGLAKKARAHFSLLAASDIQSARKHVQTMSIEEVDICSLQMGLTRSLRPSRRRRRLAWVLAAGQEHRLAGFDPVRAFLEVPGPSEVSGGQFVFTVVD